MSTRESFVATFGEEQAVALEVAGNGHRGSVLEGNKTGSDPFRDAVVLAIGFECFTNPGYRDWHGITAPADEIVAWVKEHGEIADHDGPKDYLSLLAGAYNEYVGIETP
jgi:hypothetical protein